MIKVNRALRIGSRINNSTSGEIIFTDALGKLNQDSAFFWDNVNKRLGIGTASPSSTIHLYEDDDKTGTDAGLTIEQDGTGDAILQFLLTAEKRWVIGIDHNDENKFKITKDGNLSTNGFLTIDDDGNVGIGTTNPDEKLTIDNGTLLFQNDGGLCFGEIYAQDNTTETAITTAGKVNKVQITIFNTNGHSNNTSPDHTNDHITITKAGKYMVNISLSVESIAGDSDKLGFSLYKNNGTTEFPNIHFHRDFTSGAAKTGSASMNGIIDCAVNDTIELWGWNENDTDNFLIEDVTISLFQIGG